MTASRTRAGYLPLLHSIQPRRPGTSRRCTAPLSTVPPRIPPLLAPNSAVTVATPAQISELAEICREQNISTDDRSRTRLLDLVDVLGGHPWATNRLESFVYRTRLHTELYEEIAVCARKLSDGNFDSSGTSAFALMAPRGAGKSTAFRSSTYVVPLLWRNVVPIHVNFLKPESTERSLAEFVADALAVAGVAVTRADFDYMAVDLTASKKYAMLLVDELDKLYEPNPYVGHVPGGPKPAAVRTLYELANLADQNTGRFCTIVCGSSVLLADLLSANLKANETACKEHMLIPYSINLNDSKFRTRRLHSSPPNDLKTVAQMMRLPTSEQEHIVRLIALTTGAVARSVARITKGEDVTNLVLESLDVNDSLSQPQGAIWRATMRRLREKNDVLVTELRDALKHRDRSAIASIKWETRLEPITWEEVETCVKAIRPLVQPEDLSVLVDHIYDRDYIVYGHALRSGGPDEIYPYSMMQLVVYESEPVDFSAMMRALAPRVEQALRLANAAIKVFKKAKGV